MVISVFITMTSTASASLSLEGKNRWIMCSVPVRTIDIFNSKIAVNLTVICPFALISAALLGFKMGISLKQAILLCIVPMVYACFISVLGMYMNVKLCSKGRGNFCSGNNGSRHVKQLNPPVCLHRFPEYQ